MNFFSVTLAFLSIIWYYLICPFWTRVERGVYSYIHCKLSAEETCGNGLRHMSCHQYSPFGEGYQTGSFKHLKMFHLWYLWPCCGHPLTSVVFFWWFVSVVCHCMWLFDSIIWTSHEIFWPHYCLWQWKFGNLKYACRKWRLSISLHWLWLMRPYAAFSSHTAILACLSHIWCIAHCSQRWGSLGNETWAARFLDRAAWKHRSNKLTKYFEAKSKPFGVHAQMSNHITCDPNQARH